MDSSLEGHFVGGTVFYSKIIRGKIVIVMFFFSADKTLFILFLQFIISVHIKTLHFV